MRVEGGMQWNLGLGRVFDLKGKGSSSPPLEVGLRTEANGTVRVKVHSLRMCCGVLIVSVVLAELEAWSSADIGKKLGAIFLGLVSS